MFSNRLLKFSFPVFIILLTSSCFSVTDREWLLSDSGEIQSDASTCTDVETETSNTKSLKKTGFTLVSWNIYKENKKGWMQDLSMLSADSELILLQEAYLTPTFNRFLKADGKNWDMISAFRYQAIHAGVMTLANQPSLTRCAFLIDEPLLQLPKSSLISFYAIEESHRTLLVANIHAINFSLGTEEFTKQLQQIKAVLAKHEGPIVFAGDFNTWSLQRQILLDNIIGTGLLGLNKVEFVHQGPVIIWGQRLDHIFYRGLKVVEAEALRVDSSDHFPLKVHFQFTR